MRFGIPQIIFTCLIAYNVLNGLARHGEPKKEGKYNFFTEVIAAAITITILIYGGFFE